MSFIDKEEIIKSVFITQRPNGTFVQAHGLYQQEFERDTIQVVLSPYGSDVKYLSDDKFNEMYPDGELPDNIDGEVCVFLNTSDTIKIVKGEIESLNKARKAKKKGKSRYM